jgi:hypothetical protein
MNKRNKKGKTDRDSRSFTAHEIPFIAACDLNAQLFIGVEV